MNENVSKNSHWLIFISPIVLIIQVIESLWEIVFFGNNVFLNNNRDIISLHDWSLNRILFFIVGSIIFFQFFRYYIRELKKNIVNKIDIVIVVYYFILIETIIIQPPFYYYKSLDFSFIILTLRLVLSIFALLTSLIYVPSLIRMFVKYFRKT